MKKNTIDFKPILPQTLLTPETLSYCLYLSLCYTSHGQITAYVPGPNDKAPAETMTDSVNATLSQSANHPVLVGRTLTHATCHLTVLGHIRGRQPAT